MIFLASLSLEEHEEGWKYSLSGKRAWDVCSELGKCSGVLSITNLFKAQGR